MPTSGARSRVSRAPRSQLRRRLLGAGAVQLTEIGTPVTNLGAMTCPLARAFARWTREAVQPAAQQWLDSPIVRIESYGTYACRPVNNQMGGRLSEHGRANAVDISAFVLKDGRRITIAGGWNGEDERVRRFLRAIHQAGCRRFAVGLGPERTRSITITSTSIWGEGLIAGDRVPAVT
jgi:hypothetical protein